MDINRFNYETFFIDYLDGKLNSDQTNELLSFLEQNTDLKEELENFQKITLEPDTVFYESKEKLKRTLAAHLPVGESNFDAYCVAYIEKDLSAVEENALKEYVLAHPGKKKDFEIYKKTLLTADQSIVYPFKDQRIKRVNVFRLRTIYPYIAVAATLVIAIILIYRPAGQKTTAGDAGKLAKTHVVTLKKQNQVPLQSGQAAKVFVASTVSPANTPVAFPSKHKVNKVEKFGKTEEPATQTTESITVAPDRVSDLAYLEKINVSELPAQKYDQELKINNSQTLIETGDFSKTIQNLPAHELAMANRNKEDEDENQIKPNGFFKFAKNGISKLYALLGNPIKIERKTDSDGNTLAMEITAGNFQLYSTRLK
ncbi:MAG: hypothetical protein Q8910_02085 [Bacteroidota bacterium]|nr:hypothetical protein [Bacteroidota bacterium]MDP4225152.1 hypothetical protein [Bacteroidota bacterium]